MAGAVSPRDQVTPAEWERALRVAQIPSDVMYAIGLQESGTTLHGQRGFAPWPWVLNVNEKGRFFRTREEAAEALAAEVERGNRRVAVGMLQIHLRWNGYRVSDPLTLLEPSVNLRVAAEVLAECGERFPDTFGKLACYYSGDLDEEGRWYARQVLARAGRDSREPVQQARRAPRPTAVSRPSYMVAALTPNRSAEDAAFLRSLARQPVSDRQVMVLLEGTP
jgi:hypothetical protein